PSLTGAGQQLEDLQPPRNLLRRDQVSLPRPRADLARLPPVLRRADVALPERPGAALPRPGRVDGAAPFAVVKDAIAVGLLAQAAAPADRPGVQPLGLLRPFAAQVGEVGNLLLRHPDVAWGTGAAVAAAGAAEAQAVGVPGLAHGGSTLGRNTLLILAAAAHGGNASCRNGGTRNARPVGWPRFRSAAPRRG